MTSFLPFTTNPTSKWTIIAAPLTKPLHTSSIVSKPNVTCQATKNDDEIQNPYIIGRRKALIVLGGSYGVVVLGKTAPSSSAELICPPKDALLPGVCMHTTELSLTSMIDFPRVLNSVIGVNITRPPLKSRRKKKPKEEVLVVDVELLPTDAPIVKFDVYVNDHRPYERSPLVKAEYVGSFSSSPLRHDENGDCRTMETSLKLGLDRIIEALGAQDDEIWEVSLVPRSGQDGIVIRDVRIECIYD